MLTEDKIIGIFCLVGDLLKSIGHREDSRRKISDSEVITTAIVSALYFGGHIDHRRYMMKMTGMVPQMCWAKAGSAEDCINWIDFCFVPG